MKKQVTVKEVNNVIRDIRFAPYGTDSDSIISDIGNLEYYREEAVRLIRESKLSDKDPRERLIRATRMLLLGLIYGAKESKTDG